VTGGTRVAGHGLAVTTPRRWEARIYRRERPDVSAAESPTGWRAHLLPHPNAYGHPDETHNPVLHLANFSLPPGRGDFGTGAVERMGPEHAFAAIVEYDPADADTALFADKGMPRPRLADFAPNQLQRRLPGQLGCQRFYHEHGRAFCLYIVLGSRQHAAALLPAVHEVLDSVEVDESWARL
jgi:hypothetical protein